MFSMCSLLYSPGVTLNSTPTARSPTGLADPELAAQLRTHAEDAYGFAMNTTKVLYPLSVPDAGAGYNSSSFADDLVSVTSNAGLDLDYEKGGALTLKLRCRRWRRSP